MQPEDLKTATWHQRPKTISSKPQSVREPTSLSSVGRRMAVFLRKSGSSSIVKLHCIEDHRSLEKSLHSAGDNDHHDDLSTLFISDVYFSSMMASDWQVSRKINANRNLFRELLYYGVNTVVVHGLFNNIASISRTPNVYLDKLHSIYDLDLFSLNTGIDTNILSQHFRSLY